MNQVIAAVSLILIVCGLVGLVAVLIEKSRI